MTDEVDVLVELLTEFLGDYHQHYESTITRLFKENGYEIVKPSGTVSGG